jgi:hypothetical protein
MSDYLGNLVARTFSPAVAVRPQLPSLFEPPPAIPKTTSGPEFEQESFVEQPPLNEPSGKLAPTPLSIPTPRQSVVREPEQSVPEISPAEKILEAGKESRLIPQPTSMHEAVQPRSFPRVAPTLHGDGRSNSTRSRSEATESALRDAIMSASHEVSAREEAGPSQLPVALGPVVVPESLKPKLANRSRLQAIVPMIRSSRPIASASAKAAPTISVTIGRVEVRAVMPPMAVPKPASRSAPKLSLEEYLKQRNENRS